MATINTPGGEVAGQSENITATSLDPTATTCTWNTSLGSTFSPNPSNVSGGYTSTSYTPGAAGTDTVSLSTDAGDAVTTDVVVSAATPPPPPNASWTTDATVIATLAALNQVGDLSSTAACAPVKAFQSAVRAAGGPALTVDGGYGAQTAAAAAQVAAANGGQAQAAVSTFPNCGGSGPPVVTTCPAGQVLVNGVCQPATPVVPAKSSKLWWWIAGIIVAGGVTALLWWAFGTDSGKQTLGMAGEKKKRKKKRSKKK